MPLHQQVVARQHVLAAIAVERLLAGLDGLHLCVQEIADARVGAAFAQRQAISRMMRVPLRAPVKTSSVSTRGIASMALALA